MSLILTFLRRDDLTEGQGAVQPRCHIPSAWFTCSGNIVWLLPYPWQWTPTDALDLGSSDRLISMHGWGLSSSSDWSSQLLAWVLAHPCRRPSWLCAPLPSSSCLLHSTWLDSSSRSWRTCSCTVSVSGSMSRWISWLSYCVFATKLL